MSSRALVALTTCQDRTEAERLAGTLVGERLAACVNIVPGITSVYRWEGNIEHGHEVLVVIKTTEDRFDSVERAIRAASSYELPEVLAVSVAAGSNDYLGWIASNAKDD